MKMRPSLWIFKPFGQPSYWTTRSQSPRGSMRNTRPNGMSTQYRLPLRSNDGPSRKLSTVAPWRFESDHSVRRRLRNFAGSDAKRRASMGLTSWNGLNTSARSGSELDPARQHVLPHHPVAKEAVERISERGGAIVLEKVVSDPRERVSRDKPGEQPPPVLRRKRGCKACEPERSSDEMQAAAGSVRVLREVERI